MNNNLLRRYSEMSENRPEAALAKELPYWDFLDKAVALADGSLVVGAQLKGIAIETLEDSSLNRVTLELRAALNSLSDGFEVSFHFDQHCDFDSTLHAHESLSKGIPVIESLTSERVAVLREEARQERLLQSSLYVFMYRRHRTGTRPGSSFFGAPQHFVEVKRADHEKSLRELSQAFEAFLGSLQTSGIKSKLLNGREIFALAYLSLNPLRAQEHAAPIQNQSHREQEFSPDEIEKVPALSLPSPREQLVYSDLISRYREIYLDGYFHRCISLKTLPETTYAAMASRLSQLPFPCTLHVHVQVPEQSKELSSLQTKRRIAHSMSASTGGRATDLESEARLNSAEELLREIIQTGQKIFYFQCTLILRARTLDELDSRTRIALTKYREMSGAEAFSEGVANFKVWKMCLPAAATKMVRAKRINTDNLANFLPVYQPYNGEGEGALPVCLFRNRLLGLVQYDPFDSRLPNYNCLTTGSSGVGKSALNTLIALQFAALRPITYVIDVGGSYRKLCALLGGEYIELAPPDNNETPQILNPFALGEGETAPTPHKFKFLLSFIENLLCDAEGETLASLERSLLEEKIDELYSVTLNRPPQLSDFRQLLERSDSSRLKEFAKMLYPWTGTRPYGRLLDGQTTLKTKSEFVVFDLKGLSHHPDLQSAMLLITTGFIASGLERNPGRFKRIYMDEAWELLKRPASQRMMEYWVRVLRKSGAGITFITQGLDEVVASPIGSAIIANTATKIILPQRGPLDLAEKVLKLNTQEMHLVSSTRQVKGYFSEFFLVNNDVRTVALSEMMPTEYWIATNDSRDEMLRAAYRKDHPNQSPLDVARCLGKLYPHGSAGISYQSSHLTQS